jgi:hypothetical protein
VSEGVSLKIEIDDRSKILGTFLVHKRGVISGLSEFVGRDVLIILLPKCQEVKKARERRGK